MAKAKAAKVMVCVTEDWFLLSHFGPMLATLMRIAGEVVVVTRLTGDKERLEAFGVRVIAQDYRRRTLNPLAQLWTAWRLNRLMRAERPDAIHLISVKAITVAGFAALFTDCRSVVLHFTGLGLLAIRQSPTVRWIRRLAVKVMNRLLSRGGWAILENPDDVEEIRRWGVRIDSRSTIVGGSGVDTGRFDLLPPPKNDVPVAAFAGRMIKPKGVDILVKAVQRLRADGVGIALRLYGAPDPGNRQGYSVKRLQSWNRLADVSCLGHVPDVRAIWQTADIAVVPSRSREGLPRAMLEAAASGRPLIVTDVPGCRHFVRDGVEGLVVPPGDPAALADALIQLAAHPALRRRMGEAARKRVFDGFTEDQVQAKIAEIYAQVLGARSRADAADGDTHQP